MGKLKIDLSGEDAEKNAGKVFEPLPKGVYTVKVNDVTETTSRKGDVMLKIGLQVTKGDRKGAVVFDNILPLMESVKWRTDQFLQALGIATEKKRKFTLDTDDLVGKVCKVSVDIGSYEREDGSTGTSNEVKRYVADDSDDEDLDEDDDDLDDDDDDLDEDADDSDDSDDEDDADDDEDEVPGDDEESELYTEDELKEFDASELKELFEENGYDAPATKVKAKLIAAFLEAQGGDDDDAEDDEDGEVDYDEMEAPELRKLLKDRGLNTKGAKPALVKRLQESDEEEEPF